MKWTTKLLVALIFTHGVAFAHGHNRGVFAAYESIERQQRTMSRMGLKASLRDSPSVRSYGRVDEPTP